MSNLTIQLGHPTYILSTVNSTILLFKHLENYYKAIILYEYELAPVEMDYGEEINTNLPTEYPGNKFNVAFISTTENLSITGFIHLTEEEIQEFSTEALMSIICEKMNMVWEGEGYG